MNMKHTLVIWMAVGSVAQAQSVFPDHFVGDVGGMLVASTQTRFGRKGSFQIGAVVALLSWLLINVLKEPGNMTVESKSFGPGAHVPALQQARWTVTSGACALIAFAAAREPGGELSTNPNQPLYPEQFATGGYTVPIERFAGDDINGIGEVTPDPRSGAELDHGTLDGVFCDRIRRIGCQAWQHFVQ